MQKNYNSGLYLFSSYFPLISLNAISCLVYNLKIVSRYFDESNIFYRCVRQLVMHKIYNHDLYIWGYVPLVILNVIPCPLWNLKTVAVRIC